MEDIEDYSNQEKRKKYPQYSIPLYITQVEAVGGVEAIRHHNVNTNAVLEVELSEVDHPGPGGKNQEGGHHHVGLLRMIQQRAMV